MEGSQPRPEVTRFGPEACKDGLGWSTVPRPSQESNAYYRQVANKTSVCSRRKRVAYHWRECTGDHVAETVEKLMEIVETGRRLNDYQSSLCQTAFEDLLDVAKRGRLTPGDHVKTVRYEPEVDLFEMRWTDLSVTPQDPLTGLYGDAVVVHVRLYYVEEGERWVVGLYAHEKEFLEDQDATDAAQDDHIKAALEYHHGNAHRSWGVDVVRLARAT